MLFKLQLKHLKNVFHIYELSVAAVEDVFVLLTVNVLKFT